MGNHDCDAGKLRSLEQEDHIACADIKKRNTQT